MSKLETIENQMVLGIEKIIRQSLGENLISDGDLELLIQFGLTQSELIRSVIVDESLHK